MKAAFDMDERTKTCICSVCGYKHTKETGAFGKTLEGDDWFIKIDLPLGYDGDGYTIPARRMDIYACPKCGVLQLQT